MAGDGGRWREILLPADLLVRPAQHREEEDARPGEVGTHAAGVEDRVVVDRVVPPTSERGETVTRGVLRGQHSGVALQPSRERPRPTEVDEVVRDEFGEVARVDEAVEDAGEGEGGGEGRQRGGEGDEAGWIET